MILAEDLKRAVDAVDLIGRYVRLKRRGPDRFWGLCPLHGEKSASFVVSKSRQRFKCFGCGKAGDVLEFVQRIEGVDFRGAVRLLSERYGLEQPTEGTHLSPEWKLAESEAGAFDRWLWLKRNKLLARLTAIEQREQAALAYADLCWREPDAREIAGAGDHSAHVADWAAHEFRVFVEKHQPAQRKVIHDALTLAHQARLVIDETLDAIEARPGEFLAQFLAEFYSQPDLREVLA